MPHLRLVERDYANLYNRFISLGPGIREHGLLAHGIVIPVADQYDELLQNPVGGSPDPRHLRCVEWGGRRYPSLEDALDAANVLLQLAPETNGEVSYAAFAAEEEKTGLALTDLAEPIRGVRMTFGDLLAQPRRTLISPCWTGMVNDGRAYAAWCMNVERLIPWRTLSGRQHLYLDHPWYLDFGEHLPTFKPKLDPRKTGDIVRSPTDPGALVLNFITPHGKWHIHSTYYDNHRMLTLSRGIEPCWLNDKDAASIGIADNDWVEVYNDNGVMVTEDVLQLGHRQVGEVHPCYPRLEAGHAPACFHSCVGRIRYLGLLLYDASRLEQAASAPEQELVAAQRALIADPRDPAVVASARANGISDRPARRRPRLPGLPVRQGVEAGAEATRRRIFALFARLLDYPAPDLPRAVAECRKLVASYRPEAAPPLAAFASFVAEAPLGRLEEVYTATFDLDTFSDLDATCYPYLGHHLLGESHKRSAFLVGLAERYRTHGFAVPRGELPDHLVVVLRFLASCPDEELADEIVEEALAPALRRMLGGEGGLDPQPSGKAAYLAALRALLAVCEPGPQQARRREYHKEVA